MSFLFWFLAAGITLAVTLLLVKKLGRPGNPTWSMVGMAFALPFVALSLYLYLGTPCAISASTAPAPVNHTSQKPKDKVGSVDQMLVGLEQRLKKNPNDEKGWLLLGKSYKHLGREADANNAFIKAAALGPTVPLPAGTGKQTRSAETVVRGTVSVDPKLLDKVSDSDILYVVARAPNGPPMPVAVYKSKPSSKGNEFVLSDAMAMVEGHSISNYAEVEISARISKSGNATPQSGDLEGDAQLVPVGDESKIDLMINKERS